MKVKVIVTLKEGVLDPQGKAIQQTLNGMMDRQKLTVQRCSGKTGRTELFRAQGGNYREMEERGQYLVIAEVQCRYRVPARYDDVLRLNTKLTIVDDDIAHPSPIQRKGRGVFVSAGELDLGQAIVAQHETRSTPRKEEGLGREGEREREGRAFCMHP